MEDILRKLHKEASGHKYKAIRDACTLASGELAAARLPVTEVALVMYDAREANLCSTLICDPATPKLIVTKIC